MAYFEDLTPYRYFNRTSKLLVLNVGWLAADHQFARWPIDEVDSRKVRFFYYLSKHAQTRTMRTRGWHTCPFCKEPKGAASGSAEVRVEHDGVVYAAPELIVHYVLAHDYMPPSKYVEAVLFGQPSLADDR